jgi:hypothetical protein
VHQQNFSSQIRNKPVEHAKETTGETKKGPLQCWGCGEPHLLRDFPHRNHDIKRVYNIQEATTINNVARSIPRIYATVENPQADHQVSVVELESIITRKPISILIDPGYNISYVSLRVVEACSLQRKKHTKAWLVQLAIRTKRKVVEVFKACPIWIEEF